MCELENHKFGGSGEDGDLEFNAAQEFHYDGDTSLYEDEETQQFYEKLLDLPAIIPQILVKESQRQQQGDTGTGAENVETPASSTEAESETQVNGMLGNSHVSSLVMLVYLMTVFFVVKVGIFL